MNLNIDESSSKMVLFKEKYLLKWKVSMIRKQMFAEYSWRENVTVPITFFHIKSYFNNDLKLSSTTF